MADQGANLDYLIHIYPSMQTTKPRTSLGKLSTINYLLKIYQKHSVSCCIFDALETLFTAVYFCTDTYQSNLIHSCHTIQHCRGFDLFRRTVVTMLINQGGHCVNQCFHNSKQLCRCSRIHESYSTSTWYSTWKLHSSKYSLVRRISLFLAVEGIS